MLECLGGTAEEEGGGLVWGEWGEKQKKEGGEIAQ